MTYSPNLLKYDESDLKDAQSHARIQRFIDSCKINNFKIIAIPNDASPRHYYRIITNDKKYILMDSTAHITSVSPFVTIGKFLSKHGFSTPEIYHEDLENGMLLLEDFGTDSYTKFLKEHPEKEEELYDNAVDLLVKLYDIEIDLKVPRHSVTTLNMELEIFIEWFLSSNIEKSKLDAASDEFFNIFNELYHRLSPLKPVLCLKDFMADNLMVLPSREGVKQVGILDFQDAVIGSPVRDLVSLLEDARRDVKQSIVKRAKERFVSQIANISEEDFDNAYAIAAVQNNLRIIGVFHRLNLRDNKPKYLGFLPRMWKHIDNNLKHPVLKDLNKWFKKYDISY